MSAERTRALRNKPALYARKPGPKGKQPTDNPATSAKSATDTKCDNLTLQDWLTVFAFIDNHPDMSQQAIVHHFKTLKQGTLMFTQSTLSCKVKTRKTLED
jgi:hypothetical protein